MIDKQKLIDTYQERIGISYYDGLQPLSVAKKIARDEVTAMLLEHMSRADAVYYMYKIKDELNDF